MSFVTTFIRCIFLAFGVLAAIGGIAMILSFHGERTQNIHRRSILKQSWALVEKQRASTGLLLRSVPAQTVVGQREVWVSLWQAVNWRHPREFGGGFYAGPSDKDYLLIYSNPSSDWVDILDSKTGRTSLDDTGIQNYLLSPVLTLALAYGLFYVARRLRQDVP